jgi:subtilisin family serine protease
LLLFIDQAYVYAAQKGIDIVSSSIIDYQPTCEGVPPTQPCNNVEYVLAQRAVDYARERGVTILAALGNDNVDVSDRETLGDLIRAGWDPLAPPPDPGPWAEVPGTLDGVIGVSATGYDNAKTFYSNYGLGSVDITAPGGDPLFQPAFGYTTEGGLIGAWSSTAPLPSRATIECVGLVCAPYAWQIGTSMSAPNAAGVAALIVSRYGSFDNQQGGNDSSGQNGSNGGNGNNRNSSGNGSRTHLRPELVEQYLYGSAVSLPCPNPRTVFYPDPIFDQATCRGGSRNNGFYGAGLVNALAALTQQNR